MPSLDVILLFMGAALALNLTPGPDMLYIAARSVSGGRAAGFPSALGISFGLLVHVAALAPGLAAPLAAVPAAYNAVRLAGALYLLALGVHLVLRPRRAGDFASPPPARRRAIFPRLQRLTGAVFVGLDARLALSGNR
jgi:threonine/homoserine/homoserine lactone efflux protein